MKKNHNYKLAVMLLLLVFVWGCHIPKNAMRVENKKMPGGYFRSTNDTVTSPVKWREYFTDPDLVILIDTALKNNQEINIVLQEIEIQKNEILARKGEYLPSVSLKAAAGAEKTARYTRNGAVEDNLTIAEDKKFPEPLPDFVVGTYASWELDVWKKMRNSKKAATARYLASVEGRNFSITYIVGEIASAYYELMGLDNHLDIVKKNIELQKSILETIQMEKDNARLTQLAVNRFQAQLLNTQNLQYEINQQIVQVENRINFLAGRFPQPVKRNSANFYSLNLDSVKTGTPSQLLANRPDIRQAELELQAAKLDVKSARANFYPSLSLQAGTGLQSFKPTLLLNPKSILYNLAGDLVAPLLNRNAIKALYKNASATQIQAVYKYEQTLLNAYIDVMNNVAKINNLKLSFETKSKEADILTQSITISTNLFKSARADYAEVLLTQREALESKIELVEIKMKLLNAKVNVYRALGGGWH
ncbi:MAG TPA: TolC family protein [Flavobacteriales bacterium]|nr:TolC family protein [Flavobacteriales bacterium]